MFSIAKKYFIYVVIILTISLIYPLSVLSRCDKDYNRINDYSFKDSKTIKLPVREASGIACDYRNNLLFIHEDSHNPNTVSALTTEGVLKHRIVLNGLINKDWEDITTDHNGTFWIMDSRRFIHEFKTDPEGFLVEDSIKTYQVPEELKGKDTESLDYLPDSKTFIAIFKKQGKKIYRFKPGDKTAELIGTIPKALKVAPSGLTHNPETDNFFLIAFWGSKIVEFSKDLNTVIGTMKLPKKAFCGFQPEGIEFDSNLNLYIVAEKPWYAPRGKSKLIIFYRQKNNDTINNNQ